MIPDENNGALKVVPKSHAKGIYRPETIDWTVETEEICNVEKGNYADETFNASWF